MVNSIVVLFFKKKYPKLVQVASEDIFIHLEDKI